MTLTFPNRSRSFDATRRAVRFWGHDSAMESSFFVSEDALKRLQPDLPLDEGGLLKAFDLNRDLILATAARVYARGRKGSYDLVAADFERRH
jgi:hypothetical protein